MSLFKDGGGLNDQVKDLFKNMDESEFNYLHQALSISLNVKRKMVDHKLSYEDLKEGFAKYGIKEVDSILNATHEFDLKTITKIETFFIDLKVKLIEVVKN